MAVLQGQEKMAQYISDNLTGKSKTEPCQLNLSFKALGLLFVLACYPKDYEISAEKLSVICSPNGYNSIYNGLKELEKKGLLERTRQKDTKGKFVDSIWKLKTPI